MSKIISIIGGTGAQGVPIVKALAAANYDVRVLTRDINSSRAKLLGSLPNVTLQEGKYTEEAVVRALFAGAYGAYVNTDGFSLGEREEVYWGFRLFELAAEAKVKHYVWGSLDYSTKYGKFGPKFRCGHYDGKGRIAEWLLAQKGDMVVSVLTSGPYLEMLMEGMFVPKDLGKGKFVYLQPLDPGGKIPMIAVEDIGVYALWMYNNPDKVANFDLKVATAHVDFHDVVAAFNKVNASKNLTATFEPLSIEGFLSSLNVPKDAPLTSVFMSTHPNSTNGLTFWANFSGFWNLWCANVVERDYALLDKIHPGRIRSVEEWMVMTGYDGSTEKIFKNEVLDTSFSKVARFVWNRVMGTKA